MYCIVHQKFIGSFEDPGDYFYRMWVWNETVVSVSEPMTRETAERELAARFFEPWAELYFMSEAEVTTKFCGFDVEQENMVPGERNIRVKETATIVEMKKSNG